LSQLTVVRCAVRNWHSHGHREDAYATRTPALSSMALNQTLLQAFFMYLKEILIEEHKKNFRAFFRSRHFQMRRINKQLTLNSNIA
jgi:hypothetical protein